MTDRTEDTRRCSATCSCTDCKCGDDCRCNSKN
jgi:hypothetical protein